MNCLKNIILSAAIAAAACSCSLKENPQGFVNQSNYYTTKSECQTVVNGCYRYLRSLYTRNTGFVTESCSDLCYSTSSTMNDHNLAFSPGTPMFGENVWSYGYQGVMVCNEAIYYIGNSKIAQEDKLPLVAEARVLRALYYYNLTNMFNGVPFYTYPADSQERLEQIRVLPRTDANEIRKALYEDLRDNAIPYFTEENGLKARPSEVKENRYGYALGLMLMAKFAMWYKDWDAALEPLEKLEALYGELSEERYPIEQTSWRLKNTSESIAEVQHEYSLTGIQYPSTYSTVCTPSHSYDEAGVSLFDGVYLPSLEETSITNATKIYVGPRLGWFRAAKGNVPKLDESDKYKNALFTNLPCDFDVYDATLNRYRVKLDTAAIRAMVTKDGEKVDKRVLLLLGMGNVNVDEETFGDTFDGFAANGRPWMGPKFWCPQQVSANDANNYKIFRYADAVLMMAECHCMKNNTERALYYVNQVRQRAGVDPVSIYTGQEDLMAFIRDERGRELVGEFHRKFDLVRWGIWYSETVKYNNSSPLQLNIRPYHEYYPIPDTECALSGYVLTNDAYNNGTGSEPSVEE